MKRHQLADEFLTPWRRVAYWPVALMGAVLASSIETALISAAEPAAGAQRAIHPADDSLPADGGERGAAGGPAAAPGGQSDPAGDAPALPAAIVRIKLPLTAGHDSQIQFAITRARDRLIAAARAGGEARRPLLVLEFEPDGDGAGLGSQFEPVLAISRFLVGREIGDVKTVAWLPRSVRGHGVLAVLACEEIVMAPDAELGDAGADESQQGGTSPTVAAAYREISNARRTVPQAVAESMIDPGVELVQVDGDEGSRLMLRSEVAEFRREHEVLGEQTLVAAGARARFTGREGRQMGFVKYLATDRAALAQALEVRADSLMENSGLLAEWRPVVVEIRGEITPALVGQIKTLLGESLARKVNWVALRIDSVGGDLSACIELATQIAQFDPTEVRTVAYVPVEARGGAAIIALACDELVMHPDAQLGVESTPPDANHELDNRRVPPPPGPRRPWERAEPGPQDRRSEIAAASASLRDALAPRTDRSWSLLAAMIDPGVELIAYRNKASGEERLMSAAEVAAMPDGNNWIRGGQVQAADSMLTLTGRRATQLGVAAPTVENFDQLRQRFGIRGEVPQLEPSWALKLVEVLRDPSLAAFLLFLGFVGAYIELKTPGVGIGAIVALTSFALFFWSRYLDQTAGSLEIVMFLAGLALLLVEVFVVPGFGLFGLAGGFLVIASLVLASQTFVIPRTAAELNELRRSLTIVAAAGVGVVASAIALRRVLPRAPILNRMVLGTPPPEERIMQANREALADYSFLVGVEGEATTDLRPAGKALVDDHLIDVIAEGLPLDRGTRIVVVAAHAHRVLVRAVKRA